LSSALIVPSREWSSESLFAQSRRLCKIVSFRPEEAAGKLLQQKAPNLKSL